MRKSPLCAPRPTLKICRARWLKRCASCLRRAKASPRALPVYSRTLRLLATSWSLLSTATARTCRCGSWRPRSTLLENRDLVVGPTHDGGYYLVGAKASHPDLFVSDGMGTASALDALLTRARALGLSAHLTDPFYDIDVAQDLGKLAHELERLPGRAPRTAKWLSEWASARAANKRFL